MPDLIEINKESGILEIKSFDVVSQRDIESSIAEVSRLKDEIGISKILVDTTKQKSMPDMTPLFKLFSEFPNDLRVALLANEDQSTLSSIQFAETVASNRKCKFKIFFLRDAALEWLKDSAFRFLETEKSRVTE